VATQTLPDAALDRAVEALEVMLWAGVPHPDQGRIMTELTACAKRADVSNASRDGAVRRLAACAEGLALVPATYAVFGCGLCIENGAAEPAVAVTLRFAKESVHHAAALLHAAVKARVGQANSFTREEVILYLSGGTTSPLQLIDSTGLSPEERRAARMYALLSPALYNVLSRSAEARRLIRADADFMRDLFAFRNLGQGPESQVPELLANADADQT
jgi:hypothetical protein